MRPDPAEPGQLAHRVGAVGEDEPATTVAVRSGPDHDRVAAMPGSAHDAPARRYSASASATRPRARSWAGARCALAAAIRSRRARSVTSLASPSREGRVVGAEHAVDAVDDEVTDPRVAPGQDRQPGRARLEGGDAERLEPGGREVDVAAPSSASAARRARPARAGVTQSAMACSATNRSSRRRSGPSPNSVSSHRRRRPASWCAARPAATSRTARGRLRAANRIAATTCDRRVRSARTRARRAAHSAGVDAVGEDPHLGSAPTTDCTEAAATPDTADSAAPRAPHRRAWPSARNTGCERSMRQCQVIAVGQPEPERHPGQVGGERADHPHVHVRHVEAARLQPAPHLRRRERVDRQLPRQPDRHPVDRHPVDVLDEAVPLALLAQGRGEHLDLVAARRAAAPARSCVWTSIPPSRGR